MAQAAIGQFDLVALHIVPTGQAWHKARVLSAPEHRLAMAQLAFGGLERAVVDDRELHRAGPTFTIDTLWAIQGENPAAQIYLFIGADQLAAFEQWHQWRAILEIAIICIADRAESALTQARFDQFVPHSNRFIALKLPAMPVSATLIRRALTSGAATAEEIAQWIPQAVARYISLHQLYGSG